MDKCRNKDRPEIFEQNKLIQDNARLIVEKQELENRYILVSSKINYLKNSLKNLNHDVRSPIGAITGMVDLLIRDDKDKIEVHSQDLRMIQESAKSLLDLINSTLEEQDIHESMNIDRILSSVISEINRLYLPMAHNKGISLSMDSQIDTEIHLPSHFFINLIQIIGNLIGNAIKFTPTKGSVRVVFTLDRDENPGMLNMTVTDTGKSMSAGQVSAFNLGKPVRRSKGTNGEQSYGLGLQHVIQMVSEDDGHILVKSGIGSGSKFSLSFPLSENSLTLKNVAHSYVENGTESVIDASV